MARGLNKVQLIGNLGRDPETRYTPSGAAVTKLLIATADSWNDKQTGQRIEETEWHNVVLWNRLAEVAEKYLRKGRQVYIEGKKKTRKWQDKDGNDRYTVEIIANDMQLLGGKGDDTPDNGPTHQSQDGTNPDGDAPF